jgi:hypothetical protein
MKRTAWILAIAVAAYGVYLLAGRSKEPAPVRVAATGPRSVDIVPARPSGNSTLLVRVSGQKTGKDAPASCRWFVNGEEVAGVAGAALAPEHFGRGDQVEAEVTVEAGGDAVRTPAVRIENTRPSLIAASANLRTEPSAVIYLEVSAVDPDDDEISYRYQWYRNGEEMPGETGPTVGVSHFKMGDQVHALVTAHDGSEASTAQKSDPIRIGSNAPDITSAPPTTLEPGRRFVYQVTTKARDADALRFELIDAPEGMTVDDDGLIEWSVPEASGEATDYAVAVRVSDQTGGEAVQRFRISASVQRGSVQ